MIIATAGHIDHGKTSLVRAITGIDTDRLAEEKRRGMTIDLGFAYRRLDHGGVLGFVDVPGHQRFVHTMVAGVGAVDQVLLAIAADDGPMPQTIEHLAILSLLGLDRGTLVVTKTDKVDSGRVREVTDLARQATTGGPLATAPIFPVSSATGEGIQALLDHLTVEARREPRRSDRGQFRMSVDRAFILSGIGVVATGTVLTGMVRRGDRLIVTPRGLEVRVRGLHADNRPCDGATAGERCALSLAGVSAGDIHRGDWIVAHLLHAPTQRFDADVELAAGESAPLRSGTALHVHAGTADVVGRLDVLGGGVIQLGARRKVQLVLERPVAVLHGDRFVLRDRSATWTLGGGRVLDPWPPTERRAGPDRLAALAALAEPTPARAFPALLQASPHGVDPSIFRRSWNLAADDIVAITSGTPAVTATVDHRDVVLAPERWIALAADIVDAVKGWHERRPEARGLTIEALRRRLPLRAPLSLLAGALERLIADGVLARSLGQLHLPGHEASMTAADRKLWQRVEPLYRAAGLQPPTIHELSEQLGLPARDLEAFLERMAQRSHVARVAKNRFFMADRLGDLAQLATTLADESKDGAFEAACYRDRSGLGRNLTIEVLEHFDRTGLTMRTGNARRLRKAAGQPSDNQA